MNSEADVDAAVKLIAESLLLAPSLRTVNLVVSHTAYHPSLPFAPSTSQLSNLPVRSRPSLRCSIRRDTYSMFDESKKLSEQILASVLI